MEIENENTYEIKFNHNRSENFIQMIKIKLKFFDDYPSFPPKVKFITNMFHPNIEENGMLAT